MSIVIQGKKQTNINISKSMVHSNEDALIPSDHFVDEKEVKFEKQENHLEHTHDHHDHAENKKAGSGFSMTPIVLMMALSVHALFEGIAVGLSQTQESVWTLVIAIALHKWAEAMALGISLQKTFSNNIKLVSILVILFSASTPLGVFIGILVSGDSAIVEIVFMSLAAGTFTYISCSEVIVEEFSVPKFKAIKMFMFILGAVFITLLTVYLDD